ncbi:MAG: hypothetical protein WAW63_03155 [Candidatus Saccharimonadales bacterium]
MSRKKLLLVFVLVFVLVAGIIARNIFLSSKYTATIEVEFTPLSATARVDGKRVRPGFIRTTPGKHTVSVSKDGFLSEKKTVVAPKGNAVYIGLILDPSSPATAQWYRDHPEDNQIGERISGRNTQVVADKALELEPFIKELPFIGPGFAYQIGVGVADTNGKPTIVIRAQSNEAIEDAKQWIRSMGYNPDSMKIIINPDQEIEAAT